MAVIKAARLIELGIWGSAHHMTEFEHYRKTFEAL